MRGSVEPLPGSGVGQPKVRTAVDDQRLWAELFGQCGGMPVRQRKENHIMAIQDGKLGGLNQSLSQWNQVRMVLAEHAASTGGGGRCGRDARAAAAGSRLLRSRWRRQPPLV